MTRRQIKKTTRHISTEDVTVAGHLRELQYRLFVTIAIFLGFSALSFSFFDEIVKLVVAPLGGQQQLVYLSPGGAFSFMMTLCVYVGFIMTLPVLVYHIYRFILPVVGPVTMRRALSYMVLSFLMAVLGITFAYVIILPAALHFLTNFSFSGINPMLTVDSYLSFVMTYVVAGALLFQLPIIVAMIDTIWPLTPGGMMKAQRGIILGAFIAAAILSPTPDAINQLLLATPVIIIYQVAVIWVLWQHRRRMRVDHHVSERVAPLDHSKRQNAPDQTAPRVVVSHIVESIDPPSIKTVRSLDGMVVRRNRIAPKVVVPQRHVPQRVSIPQRQPSAQFSIDGIF